jgi:hypothetical protein
MAKTTAPLLSFDGSGTVAKTMTFAKWRGIPYVRRWTKPSNPNTAKQQIVRGMFSTLSQIWLFMGAAARAPWTAYSVGRPFVDRNAFTGQNVKAMYDPDVPPTDMQAFLASPGARGGLPPADMAIIPGNGQLSITLEIPSPPSGWELHQQVALAFPDQSPEQAFAGVLTEGIVTNDEDPIVLTDLENDELYVVSVWLVWTKPNGDLAYSISLVDTATPVA